MLTLLDKEFIYNKSILNHPSYILDKWFKKHINVNNIERFIKKNNDPHYKIIYNSKLKKIYAKV
jgi:hypothetical protein